MIRKPEGGRRRGNAAVETAVVLLPLLMFVFGVMEFGRLLMAWNLLNNAARTGCRYALANNTDPTIVADVTTQVNNRMAGMNTSAFTGWSVTVGQVSTTSPYTYTSYTNAQVNNLVAGNLISVQVSGTFKFMDVVPFLNLGTVTISSTSTMVCEGVQ